ncbi:E3 ubiquitin-protein ligase FANCL isoform X2 [Thalassophryne amazonica]|uniref:E3 ubiquitin-protein ligase FANCL isoform X2 n=1 Tax=Thalassophryne amazonica TaxID=390379 RepID=UPI0014710CD1|nr:E3 ubiquitin-protein ligase FANCL isoform X2 [Thalassophryne amazonica]XP_034040215.1 E3 ubiquitin-protein ligase FANCL isoform X2 [Thalassophryne amazonica]
MESSVITENPLLLPLNKDKTVYDGFITVQEQDFRMRITLPPDRQLKLAKLHCCCQLKHLLRGYEHIMKQRLQQSADLVSFILELKTILEVGLKSHPKCRSIPPPQYYSQLISELETLGWDKLLFIDTEFQTLKLKAEDSSGRQHFITVKLKSKHPVEAPECSADLPILLAITWTPQSTLEHLHKQFLAILESLTEFWDILDEIDSNTWILEPEKPNRSDTMRRIAIGNNVSIKVEVDPRHPKMLPECCLLGADHVVMPLRNKLNTNMHLWNPDASVLHNLRDVLEIEFPSPATHEKSSFSNECGICYSYRLEAAIPDQVCNDPRCGQPFHQACLYEWLRALPSSRQSFNVVFGECPYCNKPITVKMAAHTS